MSPADPAAAYRAAKESAALFDLTGWTVLSLTGRDSAKFLHNFCTNDIKGLAKGDGCEAFVTNVKARVVGHVAAFSRGDDAFTLLSVPGQAEKLVSHLDRYVITEDVAIRDLTNEAALLYLVGPAAAGRLAPAFTEPPRTPPPGRFTSGTIRVGDKQVAAFRSDFLGGPGFLALTERQSVAEDREKFAASTGAAIAGSEVLESLRIEAAFPVYGTDVTEDHLAPEVGRPWAISYTKGCYLGQEPIARIDALGHVNRLLCGLRLDAGPAPERGAAVLADGKEVGAVTSATTSLADGRPVALAYLRTKFTEPGAAVTVRTASAGVPATVYRPAPP